MGTYQLVEEKEACKSVMTDQTAGYCLIDTAHVYQINALNKRKGCLICLMTNKKSDSPNGV